MSSDQIITGILERIEELDLELNRAKENNNIKKVQVIAGEINEALSILKESINTTSYTSYLRKGLKKGLRNIVCSESYSNLKNGVSCLVEHFEYMTGVGIGGLVFAKMCGVPLTLEIPPPRQECPPENEFMVQAIINSGLGMSVYTIMKLMIKMSEKVVHVAEDMIIREDNSVQHYDIYDMPNFRHLKDLSEDVKRIMKEINMEGECPICYRNFNNSEDEEKQVTKRWLVPCGHYYCTDCIDQMLKSNKLNKCPYCTQKVQGIADRKLEEHYQFKHKRKSRKTRKSKSRKTRKSKSRKTRKLKSRKTKSKTTRKSKSRKTKSKTTRKSKSRKTRK